MKEKKKKCRPLAAERLTAAGIFVIFVPSTRIFRAKVVYIELGSWKILSLGRS